ncbi:MAG: FkbM family methyltransferase [Alphaproteobacteria bacterium]
MTRSAQDAFSLASWHLPNWKPGLIFDVGANSGQTAGKMVQRAPEARIHAFAPVPDTYCELVANMQAHPNVVPHNLALGRAAATLNMEKYRDSRRSAFCQTRVGGQDRNWSRFRSAPAQRCSASLARRASTF